MTRSEWLKLAAVIQARWPNREISQESWGIWFEDLEPFPAGQVNAAVTALYRDGREWCPNGAQIRLKVLELGTGSRDWGKAYELTMRAASEKGFERGLGWLEEQDPAAADTAKRYGWRDFCQGETDPGTRRAQYRDLFKEVAQSAERHDRYQGIEPAGLKVLEQGNDRPVKFGDLVQLDTDDRQLGPGEDAA